MMNLNKRARGFDIRNQYGLLFDGVDDHIVLSNESAFDINDYLTVSVWLKKTGTGRGKSVTKGTGATAAGGWGWDYAGFNAGQVEFAIAGGSGISISVGSAMSTGVWHHVAAVFNKDLSGNARLKLYIDGVEQAGTYVTAGVFTTILNNDHPVVIGASATVGLPFDGGIDNVSIFNAALTSVQIAEIYNRKRPANLRAHSKSDNLKLDIGLGDGDDFFSGGVWTVYDRSSSLVSGTSVNMELSDLITGVLGEGS